MLPLLKDLISRNPFVEEVDFSDKEIYTLDSHMVELLGRFTELKKVRTFFIFICVDRFVRQSNQEIALRFKFIPPNYRLEY